MITKYTTGQAVLVPATIESAREENGVVIYEVRRNFYGGIPEDAIIVDQAAAAKAAYDREMSKLSRDIRDNFGY